MSNAGVNPYIMNEGEIDTDNSVCEPVEKLQVPSLTHTFLPVFGLRKQVRVHNHTQTGITQNDHTCTS